MNLKEIMNSSLMWAASGVMVMIVLIQSLLFLRTAFRAAKEQNIPTKECYMGLRSAMITAIGPAFSPVIVLIALIAVLGAPTAWMRMNDIGAARTELAMSSIASKIYGVGMDAANFDLAGFSYVLWGMALNNMGWIIFALLLTHRMGSAVEKINTRWDPKWVKLLMSGAALGLFSFLWSGALVKGGGHVVAGIFSFVSMFLISRLFAKRQRLLEFALGISMLIGMYSAAAFY